MASVKEIEENKVSIEFEVSDERIKKEMLTAYKKNKGKFSVPGFRRGHAPKAVIEQYYGKMVFFEDAFEVAFSDAYFDAVEEAELLTVSKPENIKIISMEEGQPLRVSAEVWLKPNVVLPDYSGQKIEFKESVITDEDVERHIERIREENARYEETEQAAKNGDIVVLDYSGSVDGEKFEGGTAEGQNLELGSGKFIKGFEEQLVGMKPGEEKDVRVTFPTDYHAEDLAGKEAVFACKIIAVKEKQLPDLDDEFAEDVSEFDTFCEYKEDVKKTLLERNERSNKSRLKLAALNKLIEITNIAVPPAMTDKQVENRAFELEYRLLSEGLTLQQYFYFCGIDRDEFMELSRKPAEDDIKIMLITEKLVEDENVEVTDDEIEADIAKTAESLGKDTKEYRESMEDDDIEYIMNRLERDKALEIAISRMEIVEPAEEDYEEEYYEEEYDDSESISEEAGENKEDEEDQA